MEPRSKEILEPTHGLRPRSEASVPLLDDPPLARMQAIVLKKLMELGDEAYGYNVLQGLSLETGVWLDPSQIYTIIRKLEKKGYITLKVTRKQEGKRPALKIFEVSEEGKAVLQTTTEHYQTVVEFLS